MILLPGVLAAWQIVIAMYATVSHNRRPPSAEATHSAVPGMQIAKGTSLDKGTHVSVGQHTALTGARLGVVDAR